MKLRMRCAPTFVFHFSRFAVERVVLMVPLTFQGLPEPARRAALLKGAHGTKEQSYERMEMGKRKSINEDANMHVSVSKRRR